MIKKLNRIFVLFIALTAIYAFGNQSQNQMGLKEQLINLEKLSWIAWQHHDGHFFQNFLSADHVEVGFGGISNKESVVNTVNDTTLCEVATYVVDQFKFTLFNASTALLTYHAMQKTVCRSLPVPSPVWVSSLYIKRNHKWENVSYQQTQTNH